MCLSQPIIPFRAPPQPVQVLRSGRGGEINVPYIHCLGGRVPEAYKPWALVEDGVREVHLYARFRILSKFREDTFTPTSLISDHSRFLYWVVEP